MSKTDSPNSLPIPKDTAELEAERILDLHVKDRPFNWPLIIAAMQEYASYIVERNSPREDQQPSGDVVEAALQVWEKNIPQPLNELLSDFAMEHTYPVRGIIRELLRKVISANTQPIKEDTPIEDKNKKL